MKKVFRVYTDERSDRMFSCTLLTSVIVIAEDESEAFDIVLSRYKDSFVCDDEELLIEVVDDIILSVSYNG